MGGTLAAGVPLTHAGAPIAAPFASSECVEGDAIHAVDLGSATSSPAHVAFLDGVQRYAVEGRIGLVPVVRAYVAAAVLVRNGTVLRVADEDSEEFLVIPSSRLTAGQRSELESVGLPIHDCADSDRAHPMLDVQVAARVVEARREEMEERLARRYLARMPDEWLVMDGSIAALSDVTDDALKLLGVIKSHETQFLAGHDLDVALTLPAGYRTSAFSRLARGRTAVYTWYLRLWPWEEHDLLHGLVRVERPATPEAVRDASAVSRWLLAERAPLAAPDGRWDRLLYPIRHVEMYLRAQAGGWW